MELLSSVLPVIVLLLVGMLCRKKQLVTDEGVGSLQSVVMNITLPVSLFLTFFHTKLTLDTLAFPAVIFFINAIGVPLGRLFCRLFRQKNRFLPFAMTSSEDGMLGYTLLALVVGQANMTTFALLDMGQVLAAFLVIFQLLEREKSGKSDSIGSAVKGLFKTPILMGMLLGMVCSLTGLSDLCDKAEISPAIDSLCDFISAPTAAVILIVIGYRINLGNLHLGKVIGAMGMRLMQQALLCGGILLAFHFIGGVFADPVTTVSVIAICSLPSSYLLPIYVEPEEEKEFYASFTSAYTLLTLAIFLVLMVLPLGI